MSEDIAQNQRVGNILEYLDMKEDKLFGGIEDGLIDFEACLDSFKVCHVSKIVDNG